MSKSEIIAALQELADLSEITDANPYEVMAYRNAARSLQEWSGEISAESDEASLMRISGIGRGIAKLLMAFIADGSAAELDQARREVPPELPLLLKVQGLGPKRVRTLWRELDITSPADLQRAANDGRVATLRGFGAATVAKIQVGLARLDRYTTPPRRARSADRQWTKDSLLSQAPRSRGRIWAGTSGFSYAGWKGKFYPPDAKTNDFLAHYAQRLRTVEINNTFYRFPKSTVIEQWIRQTPAEFRFAIKAHRRITHQMRFSEDSRDTILDFVQQCRQLGPRLGCILFQLPPNLPRNDERLDFLLHVLPTGPRYAVEFRHASWFDSAVLKSLSHSNVACVAGDTADEQARRELTADFAYVRLRRPSYSEQQLDEWQNWTRKLAADKRDVFVYLKHDDVGETPEIVLHRWFHPTGTVQERLQDALASPTTDTKRQRRKSG